MRITPLGLFAIPLLITGCGGENTNETIPEESDTPITDTVAIEDPVEMIEEDWFPDDRPVEDWELNLKEGVYSERFFRELFTHDFEQAYDFGFRFISANYEDVDPDPNVEETSYNTEFSVEDVSVVRMMRDGSGGDENIKIPFAGYAHSFRYYEDKMLFVTYELQEITEVFHYYYVDENFTVLEEGELASNGGDEGAWEYRYGEFSKDYSVYELKFALGEGKDTFDFGTEMIYFD